MSKPHLLFFIVSLFSALVSADYTIDDSDYSVLRFSNNPSGPVWGPFGSDSGEVLDLRLPNGTMQSVDATQCYDATFTYAACAATDNCGVQFSFTGSGITIYVLQAGPRGMSASLSIDSGSQTTAILDAPPAPQYYIPSVILFNIQNITSGTHSAVMTVQDWNGGFSGMMLDYIDVSNSTASSSIQPTATQTSSPSVSSAAILSVQSSNTAASPSSTQSGNGTGIPVSSSSSINTNLAAIVGGVVGGVGGVFALLCLIFFCFRHQRSRKESSPPLSPRLEARFMDPGVPVTVQFLSPAGLPTSQSARVPSAPFRSLQSWTDSEASTHNMATNPGLMTGVSYTRDPFAHFSSLRSWTDSEANSTPNLATNPSLMTRAFHTRDPSAPFLSLRSWTDSEADSTLNLATNPSLMTRVSHMRGASTGGDSATSSAPAPLGVIAEATATVDAATTAEIPQEQDTAAPTQPLEQLAERPEGGGEDSGGNEYPDEKAGPAPGDDVQEEDPDVPGTGPNLVLTDGRAGFVDDQYNTSVPAPVVTRVLERMLANPQGTAMTGFSDPELRLHLNPVSFSATSQAREWYAESEMGDEEMTTPGTAPPSYDYAQAH